VGREAQQTVQAQRSIPTMGGAAGERGVSVTWELEEVLLLQLHHRAQ